ncbi:oligosaccharide flippase family protein [Lichenicola sp.]|uniref:oligosaccharide flippase family protein n=1 Tax=Lichenicola sp. TaxID=2804529 RepID=UPI003B0000D9
MSSTRRALAWSLLERYTTTLVYAVSNVVLSRLLTPHDTGLFTVGFALTVLIGTFRDFGVATYVIQEPDLTDAKWRAALGVSAITSLAVFAVLVVASVFAGRAYHDPAVTRVMLVSGLTLLLIPLNSLVLTWLRREMRYGVLSRITLAGAAIQSVVTIALAWAGDGAMSMAWGSVANSAVLLVGSIRHRPRQFGCLPSLAGWRPIARLGGYSTIAGLCNEITPHGADLFIGRFAGLSALGQFSKGSSLVGFVNQGVTSAVLPVALSLFAARRRAGQALDVALPHAMALLTGLTWPAFAGLAVISTPLIHLLFGSQWSPAIAPARIIVLTAMLTSLTAVHTAIYQATGAMRARMVIQLWVTPMQLLVLFVAAHGTLVQAAIGTTVSAAIELLPSQFAANRICSTSMAAVATALLPSAVVTACTVGGAIAGTTLVHPGPHAALALAAGLLGGGFGWIAGLGLSHHRLGVELLSAVRDVHRLSTGRA